MYLQNTLHGSVVVYKFLNFAAPQIINKPRPYDEMMQRPESKKGRD